MSSRAPEQQPAAPPAAAAPRRGPSAFTITPSKRTCTALAACMGVVFAGGAGLGFWQKGDIERMRAQVAARQATLRQGERTASRLAASEAAYRETEGQLRFLETSVTAGQYVPTLLRQMEMLARSVDLQVGAVRPTLEPAPLPPSDKEARKKFTPWPYDKIHVDMEVHGSYWSVAKLLYRLSEFPKILAVESVQVQPAAGSGEAKQGVAPQLSVNVKLTGFIFPNDGKPDPALAAAGDAVASTAGTGGGATQVASARTAGTVTPGKEAAR